MKQRSLCSQLVEIELLYARMELSLRQNDQHATERALYHINQALKLISEPEFDAPADSDVSTDQVPTPFTTQ